jgi:cysteine desulfurase/selenocysteine lyase
MKIDSIRRDTAGIEGKIFLNSAGSSLMPKPVIEKMIAYLKEEETSGGYRTEMLRQEDIASFYKETALLLNCGEHQIAFTYNATDAYARALSSIPFKLGDIILTSADDYVSNHIAFLSLKKRFGIRILMANNLENGDLDLQHFENMVKENKPALVALTHIPTNSGMVQNAEEVGKICKTYDILYLLDACQSIGQIPVDVQNIGCDFLSATGRKFLRGPRGTGFLFVSDKVLEMGLEPLFPDMKGADWIAAETYKPVSTGRRFEQFEASFASLIGLAEAIRYANNIGLGNIETINRELCEKLRKNLSGLNGINLLDKGSRLSSIITLHTANVPLEKLEQELSKSQIMFSVSLRKNALIDMDKKGVEWALRFSPHYFNTAHEIDVLATVLADIK